MNLKLPNTFILGAQKSGTTTIAELLASHPQISQGQTKELNVFGCHDENARIHKFEHWQNPSAEVRIDASTYYLQSPASLKRIRELCGDAVRAIVILREPASRAVSAYWHHVTTGFEKRTPEEAFACLETGPSPASLQTVLEHENHDLISAVIEQKFLVHHWAWRFPDPLWSSRYIHNSDYCCHLQKTFEILGRERVLVLFTDELRKDRQSALLRIATFLGVSAADFPTTADVPDANVRSVSRTSVAAAALKTVKRLTPEWIISHAPASIVRRYRSTVYERPPKLNDAIARRLRELFTQQNAALSVLLDRQLPEDWEQPARPTA